DVDLVKRLVHVRRSKNETSHRVIPLNASAVEAAARMFERADLLGHIEPEHYLWPACQWGRYDATNPMLKWDTAWRGLRDAAGLPGLRFRDLRHTVITELAEMGVADHLLESISGHLSRRMLEHYSHIRNDANDRRWMPSMPPGARQRIMTMAMGSRRSSASRGSTSSRQPGSRSRE
ncbi:MAG TPA: tyrosine-type recombinase/integrase, partial [Vicinamibacterales bacterium]|nr:tyrosine-type recombinase/integrase [Vicinamibacterales bacterium]